MNIELQRGTPAAGAYARLVQTDHVLSFVHCSEEGEILAQEGDEVEILAEALTYFHQMAALIGESFGLEGFEEARIQGRSLSILAMPHQGGLLGVVVHVKARIASVIDEMRAIVGTR